MASGTWFGETSRQSQAEPVKQQHTEISPNHVPEAVPYYTSYDASPSSDPPAPMILCANKVDMAQKRIVSSDAGREMARRLGVPYMETSAKDPPQNIDDVFREAVRLIRRGQGEGERGSAKNKRCSVM